MKYDLEKIMSNSVAKQWVYLCMAENKDNLAQWFKDKNEYWKQHSSELEPFGFTFSGGITHALDQVLIEKVEDLEGCLLLIRVGTDAQPAATTDIELAHKVIAQALEGVDGVRVIISHHAIDIKKVSLPALRKLQSEVLSSTESGSSGDLILDVNDL